MSWRQIQKSRAKPVWLPMRKRHYRCVTSTAQLRPPLKRAQRFLIESIGSFRKAPFTLALDSSRFFQRCPEQINLSLRNIFKDLMVELTYAIRRPRNKKPIVYNRKQDRYIRVPDYFYQHTQSWRYCLDNPSHARAFQQLLKHTMAFVSGYDAGARRQGKFRGLYWYSIGDVVELARWPIQNISAVVDGRTIMGLSGFEVLEAVCIPGERPRRPKVLCGPRPQDPKAARHYDCAKKHWYRQLRDTNSKQIQLRVRRITEDGLPAFYFNGMTDLDLPLHAVRRLQQHLPSFWRRVYRHYKQEAGLGWPRVSRKWAEGEPRYYPVIPQLYWKSRREREAYFYNIERSDTGKIIHKSVWERAPLSGSLNDQRQFNWNQELADRFFHPEVIDHLCTAGQQDGLWALAPQDNIERHSKEYRLRVALLGEGLLCWDPEWSVDVDTAVKDLATYRQQYETAMIKMLQITIMSFALKVRRRKRPQVKRGWTTSTTALPGRPHIHTVLSARAPPS
jgi:hypothetical protein